MALVLIFFKDCNFKHRKTQRKESPVQKKSIPLLWNKAQLKNSSNEFLNCGSFRRPIMHCVFAWPWPWKWIWLRKRTMMRFIAATASYQDCSNRTRKWTLRVVEWRKRPTRTKDCSIMKKSLKMWFKKIWNCRICVLANLL